MITIVAAIGEKNELAKDDKMLWSLPDDYNRFKAITKGFPVIMGRKSVETMLDVLEDRTVFAISRNKKYQHENVITVTSMEDAIYEAKKINEQIFIIGGGQIYDMGIELTDKIEITRVHGIFPDANVFFPKFLSDKWQLTHFEEHSTDVSHIYTFTYETWIRR